MKLLIAAVKNIFLSWKEINAYLHSVDDRNETCKVILFSDYPINSNEKKVIKQMDVYAFIQFTYVGTS